ncbi:unnamed protein product [Urochloa humidicola]
MSPPPAPPELIDDAIAEILLRIPPHEPADLRASLVCKPWLRVASDPAFLRRYRAFHRGAPLLGFFYSVGCPSCSPLFIPTTAARPLRLPAHDDHSWFVHDCRHGRVLLWKTHRKFAVWDPITGYLEELPKLDIFYSSFTAVVLCAVSGCDHCDCHGGPFLVVCVGNGDADMAARAVYSSEASAWGTPDSTYLDGGLPAVYKKRPLLLQNEDGSLGFAGVTGSRLHLWSRMANSEGVTGWVQQRVIKHKILPKATVFAFAEGAGVFIMSTKAGAFTFDLKSERVREVGGYVDYCTFSPFISFFTPDYACGKLPLLAETN